MSKPGILPMWAEQDLVDPTSGVNNVTTPPAGFQDYGHNPAGVYPKRQYENWFRRWVYRWLKYVDQELEPQVNDLLVDTEIPAKIDIPDASAENLFDLDVLTTFRSLDGIPQQVAKILRIRFPGITRGIGTSNLLRIYPQTSTWPAYMVLGAVRRPFLVVEGSGEDILVGSITFPSVNTQPLTLSIPDRYNVVMADIQGLIADGWINTWVGWPAQTVEIFVG